MKGIWGSPRPLDRSQTITGTSVDDSILNVGTGGEFRKTCEGFRFDMSNLSESCLKYCNIA